MSHAELIHELWAATMRLGQTSPEALAASLPARDADKLKAAARHLREIELAVRAIRDSENHT